MSRKTGELPSLRALQSFDAVVRTGSISQAAAELHVSGGAVSQQVRLLEKHLGVRLIERDGRGIAITRRGRAYHLQASTALALLLKAQLDIESARKSSGLTISALPSVVSSWLGPSLFRFRKRYPASHIHLIGSDDEPPSEDSAFDFRISYGRRARNYRHSAELFTDSAVPVCSRSFARAAALKDPADLLHFPLIGTDWGTGFTPAPSWGEWFRSVGLTLGQTPPGVSFSLSGAAISAAVEGHGFALAQLSMVEAELGTGRLVVPFDRPMKLAEPYFLAWSADALEKRHGAALHTWLIAAGRAFSTAKRG
ncbi:MAG: LysR substrate-binding domain-containing protein [Gammaproteobacteria bacterium]